MRRVQPVHCARRSNREGLEALHTPLATRWRGLSPCTCAAEVWLPRKINRGFEGNTHGGEKTLYLVLQSPLSNPDKKTGDASRHTRLLVFDIASEKPTAEYVYRFDAIKDLVFPIKFGPDEMKLSAVAPVNATTPIVERDSVAKLYSVDINKATNILGSQWDNATTTPASKPWRTRRRAATPLPKTLVADLSKLPESLTRLRVWRC